MSRDKLVGYLWPETDTKRARHVLNQLVYAQRQQFGPDDLLSGRKTLRLNDRVIWTDVREFEQALARGEDEPAVALYAGPFLDGFFLEGSPEFEQWADGQRRRLARACIEAVRRMAELAGANGKAQDAVKWWRRAVDLEPLEAGSVFCLVEALAAAGDRIAALQEARRYEDRLQRELGVPVEPRMRELMSQLMSH
jgi:DNA-binding SARP family transcriptional activator